MREASLQRYPIEFSNLKANYTYIVYQTQVNFKKDLKKKNGSVELFLLKIRQVVVNLLLLIS